MQDKGWKCWTCLLFTSFFRRPSSIPGLFASFKVLRFEEFRNLHCLVELMSRPEARQGGGKNVERRSKKRLLQLSGQELAPFLNCESGFFYGWWGLLLRERMSQKGGQSRQGGLEEAEVEWVECRSCFLRIDNLFALCFASWIVCGFDSCSTNFSSVWWILFHLCNELNEEVMLMRRARAPDWELRGRNFGSSFKHSILLNRICAASPERKPKQNQEQNQTGASKVERSS